MSDDQSGSAPAAAAGKPPGGVPSQASGAAGGPRPAAGGVGAADGASGPPPDPSRQRDAIVADQHGALIADFGKGYAEIACNDRAFMDTRGRGPVTWERSGEVRNLPDRDPDDAFVFVTAGGKPELWARPDYADYDRLFDIFSKQYYGVTWSEIASGQEWNIDHLYPHTAAELGSVKYVRLTPVDAVANQLMGTNLEKQMARRQREINRLAGGDPPSEQRPVLKATYFTIGKLTGFHDSIKLPKNRSDFTDRAVIDRLVAHVTKECRFLEPDVVSRLNAVLTRRTATTVQTALDKRLEKLTRFDDAHPEFLKRRR